MEAFNGKPLPSELRRLSRKSTGDCASVMLLAAEALENGTTPVFKGRPLAGALQSLATRNMGDAKAAMHVAADLLANSGLIAPSK
ncbi:hypothetical protein ACUVZD_000147 [Pseudomonas aeruginosa]